VRRDVDKTIGIAAVPARTGFADNAASDDRHTWEEVTVEYRNDRLDVNLRHYFFAIQALTPQMLEAGSARS
jgi:hypothetical protein